MKRSLYFILLVSLTSQNFQAADKVSKITQWAKQKKENAQRLFFCLANPSQCDKKEVKTARTWVIGTSAAIIIAVAAAIGLTLTAKKVQEIKDEQLVQEATQLAQNPLYQRINQIYTILEGFSSRLGTTPRVASREVENYDTFTAAISKPEVEQFKQLVQDMYQLSQQTLGTTQLDEKLQEECQIAEQHKKFMCEMRDKFKAIKKFSDELKGFESKLDQYYTMKRK